MKVFWTLILVVIVGSGFPALAETWRVEQDGSGDFDNIQPAVDASAPGDTILIGPGNYNQMHSVLIPEWPQPTDVAVYVTTENLTFIGSGADQVFVGPDQFYPTFFGPIGFCGANLADTWRVEGISIHNVRDGIYAEGRFEATECRFQNNSSSGILTWAIGGVSVNSCDFENNLQGGVSTLSPSGPVDISGCFFFLSKLNFQNTQGITVQSCQMIGDDVFGGQVGLQCDGASATIISCTFSGFGNFGVSGLSNSTIDLVDCSIQGDDSAVFSKEHSTIGITSSTIIGNLWCMVTQSGGTISAKQCHFQKNEGSYILCRQYWDAPLVIDLTYNFWSTYDVELIAAGIHDGNDDPNLTYTVDFQPLAEDPISTESTSWGDLKTMFR